MRPPERPHSGSPTGRFGAHRPAGGATGERMPAGPPHEPQALIDWRPAAGSGALIGLTLLLASLALAALAFWRVRADDGVARGLWLLLCVATVVGALYVGYLLRGLATMRYVFMPDALRVHWQRQRLDIAYADVIDVTFAPRTALRLAPFEPFWPGCYVSVIQRPDGVWRSFATLPPSRRVRIATRDAVIAISPRRPVLFQAELARRREAFALTPDVARGALPLTRPVTAQPAAPHARPPARPPARQPPPAEAPPQRSTVAHVYHVLFRERLLGDAVTSALIAAGVALPLLMAAYLYSQYEGLPRDVPLHWNAHGAPDRVGAPRDLWLLPITAASLLVANTALATFATAVDRFAARLLTAATPIAQIAAFIALLRIVN